MSDESILAQTLQFLWTVTKCAERDRLIKIITQRLEE